MSEIRFEAIIWVGIATVGLGLLASTDAIEEWRDPVVLNPRPPEAPRQGLKWDLGVQPTKAGIEAGAQLAVSPCDAGEGAGKGVDFELEAVPAEDPYAG